MANKTEKGRIKVRAFMCHKDVLLFLSQKKGLPARVSLCIRHVAIND